MLEKYLQIESLSLVFLGDFNPVILQPFWLSSKKLIREEEAVSANVEIIHSEIVKFELDWASIEATKYRCVFKTNKAPYFELLRDLATSVFRILKETPIKSFGVNHVFDLSLQNEGNYYNFGNKISPLSLWSNSLNDPRLLNIEILENNRKDNLKGHYRLRVVPSDKGIDFGVSVSINDHYDIESKLNGTSLKSVELLEDRWGFSFKRAKEVVTNLIEKTL